MRSARIYRYPQAGTGFSRWTRWTGYFLKTFVGLSVVWFDFALLLLAVRESLMLSFPDEFLKWTKAGGRVLPGLVKRRNDERALYLSGVV
jgi:hypothetical protein